MLLRGEKFEHLDSKEQRIGTNEKSKNVTFFIFYFYMRMKFKFLIDGPLVFLSCIRVYYERICNFSAKPFVRLIPSLRHTDATINRPPAGRLSASMDTVTLKIITSRVPLHLCTIDIESC